ncbi:MAG: hypothetical protein ACT4OK_14125 [Gemmobacter sp.]
MLGKVWSNVIMALEDIADLIRANSANLNRRMEEFHVESYGQLLNLQNDVTDVRGDVKGLQGDVGVLKADVQTLKGDVGVVMADVHDVKGDVAEAKADLAHVKRSLDLAETVTMLRRQVERLEADVAALKRRA